MTCENKENLLQQLDIFQYLTKSELKKILKISKYRVFYPGEQITQQGAIGKELIIWGSGRVEVFIEGVKVSLFQPERTTIIGEVTFFTGGPILASTIALDKIEALLISHDALRSLISLSPSLGIKICNRLTIEVIEKLKASTSQLIYLMLGDISKQSAHDIRSPLAALKVLSSQLPSVPLKQIEMINLIVERLEKVAGGLLGNNRLSNTFEISFTSPSDCIQVIRNIFLEKQLQYQATIELNSIFNGDFEINKDKEQKIRTNLIELGRLLSNLIDNGVQASPALGKVVLEVHKEQKRLLVKIRDSGHGMSKEILHKIGKSRVTFGKENGNGLGLMHAYQQINHWGGKIKISSSKNRGTSVSIVLPVVRH